MNEKILAIALMSLAAVVVISGCIGASTESTIEPAGTGVQADESAVENELVASVESDWVSESDDVEIGEMY